MESENGYRYTPLSDADFIRLISIKPQSKYSFKPSKISLTITNHQLNQIPEFDCLSYTWGDPTPPYSKQAKTSKDVFESTGEILLNEHKFPVKRNLMDALTRLSRMSLREKSHYIWIDALCINQQDLDERASQVAIMDKIYREARNVIVWLGQENEFTKDAISLLKKIHKIPRERYKHVGVGEWHDYNNTFIQMGVYFPPGFKEWLSLIAFFNMPFLQRVWIIQEIILARKVEIVWGKHRFSWDLVRSIASFLEGTGWHTYLQGTHMRTLPMVVEKAGVYHQLLQIENADVRFHLEQVRRDYGGNGDGTLFRNLLVAFRLSQSTDPRDKIYALLSMAQKTKPPFSSNPDILLPDYRISAKDLYIKVMRSLLQSYPDLRCLCMVEDRSVRNLDDLPTWVPDFTAPLRPLPLSYRGFYKYRASEGVPQLTEFGNSPEATLPVSGYRLSKVEALSVPPDPSSTDAQKIHSYWGQVFQFAAEVPEIQFKSTDRYVSRFPHSKSLEFLTRSRSVGRTEVLWRTLCGNNINAQYPAPSSTNQILLYWLVWIVFNAFVFEEKGYKAYTGVDIVPPAGAVTWPLLLEPIRRLLQTEPPESMFRLDEFDAVFAESVQSADPRQDFKWVEQACSGWFFAMSAHHSGNRREFQDSDRRLGMAPKSAKVGDEVWIIGGCPTPCLLRPAAGRGNYEFMGEVYMYGIMDGELAECGILRQVERITLV
ncbi:hypothetical protein G7Y89_g8154 [Cudoniella acicularis]|uniref:Heterokaryon incompatibility domain-containing protein n=1 Tax=Cudoniella acicularis TaxID=354080 RepID=A0A8H4RKR6_9HELO|nr:hypothetical protein G7Y89_g8154 [Cudoniella acicularis]